MVVKDSSILPIIIGIRILSRNPNKEIPSLGKVKTRQRESASFVAKRVTGRRNVLTT